MYWTGSNTGNCSASTSSAPSSSTQAAAATAAATRLAAVAAVGDSDDIRPSREEAPPMNEWAIAPFMSSFGASAADEPLFSSWAAWAGTKQRPQMNTRRVQPRPTFALGVGRPQDTNLPRARERNMRHWEGKNKQPCNTTPSAVSLLPNEWIHIVLFMFSMQGGNKQAYQVGLAPLGSAIHILQGK